MDIPVYLVTGFLDAGKTDFINGILEDGFAKKDKTLLLCCEEGENEYNEKALRNVTVVTVEEQEELTCSFLKECEKKYHPKQVLIEYNGMWPLEPLYRDILPAVLLGSCVPEASGVRVNSVSTDNFVGGRMAAEYLHRLGHRDVVYLGLRSGSVTHTLRHAGFLAAARELGMTVTTVENTGPSSTISSGYQMARRLFAAPLSQTALFAASDAVALGAIQAADESGIAIPERLSILGFDNIEYAALPNIRLSTLSQNTPLLARAAVRLLLELIDSDSRDEYTCKLITPTLVERATCAPPPC